LAVSRWRGISYQAIAGRPGASPGAASCRVAAPGAVQRPAARRGMGLAARRGPGGRSLARCGRPPGSTT